MLRKSYYLTLGISPCESAAGIRQAFREIAKRYHPDRVGSERLRYFQEIVEAYHVLTDRERRRDYDRGLSHADASAGRAAVPVSMGAGRPDDLPRTLSVLGVVTIKDAAFEAALARVSWDLTSAGPVSKTIPEGLDARVILNPEEATQGGVLFLTVPGCSPCERCGGSGREGLFPCSLCDGEGLIEEEEMQRVQVPPMVGDGTILDIPLRGLGVHNFYLRLHIRVGF